MINILKTSQSGLAFFLPLLNLLAISSVFPQFALSQEGDYFTDQTMRVDYFHIADAGSEIFTLDKIYRQGEWSGNLHHMIDPFAIGSYFLKVYDQSSDRLIFSRGYSTYSSEYRTTDIAIAGIKRTYHESLLLPYPKQPVRLVIESRDKKNIFHSVWQISIDPQDAGISTVNSVYNPETRTVLYNGSCREKVDLVFLAEGYTDKERNKFNQDVRRYLTWFFNWQPYQNCKNKFNVYTIYTPSAESGSDEPQKGTFKSTVLNSSFNSLGSPRYLLTEDNRTMRDIAALVPYDAIIILVNSPEYGGGGIYNLYAILTADHPTGEYLLHHEFGHSFGGLADEYYTSDVAYSDFYPPGIEPSDPNLTAWLDPPRVKWAAFLSPGIDIPTNWQQQTYDSLQALSSQNRQEWIRLQTDMQERNLPVDSLTELRKKYMHRENQLKNQIDDFFRNHPKRGMIGLFEGAGYKSKGLYRPTLNSIMFRFAPEDKSFYAVSEAHIKDIIEYYCTTDQ